MYIVTDKLQIQQMKNKQLYEYMLKIYKKRLKQKLLNATKYNPEQVHRIQYKLVLVEKSLSLEEKN